MNSKVIHTSNDPCHIEFGTHIRIGDERLPARVTVAIYDDCSFSGNEQRAYGFPVGDLIQVKVCKKEGDFKLNLSSISRNCYEALVEEGLDVYDSMDDGLADETLGWM